MATDKQRLRIAILRKMRAQLADVAAKVDEAREAGKMSPDLYGKTHREIAAQGEAMDFAISELERAYPSAATQIEARGEPVT